MSPLQNERGMALLLVLVVVALLSALLAEFSFSTLVDLRATETFRDRTKAYYLARGGVEAARMILLEDRNAFDHPSEFWGDDLASVPAGDGDVSLEISDLSGRFNLNSVADTRGNRLPGYHRFVALCEEALLVDRVTAQGLADALLHWFNGDRTRPTADDGYYAQQTPPYGRKGGKLDSVDELLLLRGFDPDLLARLEPLVRVAGDETINLNTASAEVLFAWQHSAAEGNVAIIFDRADIAAITAYIRRTPLRQLADLEEVEGIGQRWSAAWLQGSVGVTGSIYQVLSRGRVNQIDRLAEAAIIKQGNQLLTLKVE